jgi:hypothetical protein
MVQDEALPAARREQARASLVPFVRRQARRLAAGRGQVGQDLIDESASWVLHPERLRNFDPGRGSFAGWCASVLRNRRHDLGRESERQQLHREKAPLGDSVVALAGQQASLRADLRLDLVAPFAPGDLAEIESWPPWDRIALLCLGLLWQKVPPETWTRWVGQCRLGQPFPPPEYVQVLDAPRQERHDCLAQILGWSRNTLSQRWCRGQRRLLDLTFIQGLRQP